jgi:Glycosyl hydrolase catalytic core
MTSMRWLRRLRQRRVSACALLVACCLALPASAASGAQAPRGFFGIQAWETPTSAEFDAMGRGRVDVFRFNLDWSTVEPHPGDRAWGHYDQLVTAAARNGIQLLAVLYGSPAFATFHRTDPPISASASRFFARFITEAVRRYGRGGVFWKLHRELPYTPIVTWQVWNEPNFAAYWYGKPNARQYVALVKVARSAILKADRKARIMLAGLPESRGGIPIVRYLQSIYAVHGSRSLFDVVAVNPYARDQAGVVAAVKRVRSVMDQNHDTRKPIWLTELGWATGGPGSPFRVSLNGQATRLTQSYRAAISLQRRYRVGAVIWFSLRDRRLVAGERDWWAPHTGLFALSGKAKPAWRAFVNLTGGSVR